MTEAHNFVVEELPDQKQVRLRILTPRMDVGHRQAFAEACESLLASRHKSLILDLSGLPRIFSLFIGSLVDLTQRAEAADKRLEIHVTAGVRNTLERMNLGETLTLETVS